MPFEILGRQHALDEVLHVLLIIAQYFFVVLTQMKASAFQFVFGDTRFGEAGPFFLHQCKRRIGGFPRAGRSHVHHAPSRLRMPSNMGLHGVRKTFLFSNTVHQASGGGTAKRNHSQRERGAQRIVFVQCQGKRAAYFRTRLVAHFHLIHGNYRTAGGNRRYKGALMFGIRYRLRVVGVRVLGLLWCNIAANREIDQTACRKTTHLIERGRIVPSEQGIDFGLQ